MFAIRSGSAVDIAVTTSKELGINFTLSVAGDYDKNEPLYVTLSEDSEDEVRAQTRKGTLALLIPKGEFAREFRRRALDSLA